MNVDKRKHVGTFKYPHKGYDFHVGLSEASVHLSMANLRCNDGAKDLTETTKLRENESRLKRHKPTHY